MSISSPLRHALKDVSLHLLFACLVNLPLFVFRPGLDLVVVVVLFGVLIDLDHAVAARSISVSQMISLPMRPITHSFIFAFLSFLVVFAITGVRHLSWAALSSYVVHLLWDATGSKTTPSLWPSRQGIDIRRRHLIAGMVVLFLISFLWSSG